MRLIERYLFRQLLGPALLASAALSGVAILTQTLSGLDILVNDRQSPLVFAQITLLAMPQLVVMILPVAVLVAALVALNRLHTEQEIVICFAGGMSRWRVASPALRLAILAALASLVLSLWIQPLSYRAMRAILQDVRSDLAATLVKPGQFTHPAPGLTVYAQSVDEDGLIHNLFIDQNNGKGRDVTVIAEEGRFETRGNFPILMMRHGANQEFSKTDALNFLAFDEYAFDLRALTPSRQGVHYKLSDRYLHELFFPDLRQSWEQANRKKLLAEGHARLASALYNIAFMAMALAGVLGGSFSRLGYGQRIATTGVSALVLRTLGFAAQAAAGGAPVFNVLQYLLPLGATALSAVILFAPLRRPAARHEPAAPALHGQPA
ncbi:MAG TPA: LPS export ABC transporter permease LptF [Caulobacteraceae bacterium]